MHEVADKVKTQQKRRVFDCPWCGAVCSVAPVRLDTTYACPECGETTRLTAKNTRAGKLIDAPVGAPPARGAPRRWPLVAVGVVVAGLLAWLLSTSAGSGAGEEAPTVTPVAVETPDAEFDPGPYVETPSLPPGDAPDEPAEEAAPVPPEPTEEVTESAADPPPSETPADRLLAAESAVLATEAALVRARSALEAWEEENPVVTEVVRDEAALRDVAEEARRAWEAVEGQALTPAIARDYNATLRAFIAADPRRIRGAERLLERVVSQAVGRPMALTSWEGLSFHSASVRDALGVLVEEGRAFEPPELTRLRTDVAARIAENTAATAAYAALAGESGD